MAASTTPATASNNGASTTVVKTPIPKASQAVLENRKEESAKTKRNRDTPGEEAASNSNYELQNPPQINRAPNRRRKADPRKWTEEEDEILRKAVLKHGEKNWKAIADSITGRNHTQCLQRWTKVLAPGLKKGPWQPHEDEMLRDLVAEGRRNWGQVASKIPGRTSKQCRERWYNHLDPQINKNPFSDEEDKVILQAQALLGNRWSQIASMLEGRTEDAVKIRWKSLCRKLAKQVAERKPEQMVALEHHQVVHPSMGHSIAYGVPGIAQAFIMNQSHNKGSFSHYPNVYHPGHNAPNDMGLNGPMVWAAPPQKQPQPMFFQQQHQANQSLNHRMAMESAYHQQQAMNGHYRTLQPPIPVNNGNRFESMRMPASSERESGSNAFGRASLDEFLKDLAGDPTSSRLSSTAGILSELLMNNAADEESMADMWRISGSMNRLSL